jgi:predicted metal-dependent hydrolase
MTSSEPSEVRVGADTAIIYKMERSRQLRRPVVGFDQDQVPLVTAPPNMTTARLDRFVRAQAPWLVERLHHFALHGPYAAPHDFVDGETFLYLGRQYRLRIVVCQKIRAVLSGRRLVAMVRDSRPSCVRWPLGAWYCQQAAKKLRERAAILAKKMSMPVPPILIWSHRREWGTCDAQGNLHLNWRIIQAPMRLVDYVVAHELVHLRYRKRHRKHTAAFWAALGRMMPDYQARREELRLIGARLDWGDPRANASKS